jgi:hypothetical protein
VAFTGATTVVLAGYEVTATGAAGGVATCTIGRGCAPAALLPGAANPWVTVSPTVFTDKLVLAYYAGKAYVSRDGGATFGTTWTAPSGAGIAAASIGGGPVGPRIALATSAAGDTVQAVLISDDLGRTFSPITGNLDATYVLVGVQTLPGGNVLAGLTADGTGKFGLRETSGNGTWTRAF